MTFVIQSQLSPEFSQKFIVTAGAGAIAKGVPTKSADAAGASTGAAVVMVDGDGTTSQIFTGIAKDASSQTASVAGEVYTWLPLPGIVYAGKTKTAATADTQAELDALVRKRTVFDLTTGVWTIDGAALDAAVNCVVIIGGDFRTQVLNFTYKPAGTLI
jgi:hypothetical protein